MAEPLGVASSIVGLISLAQKIVRYSSVLHDIQESSIFTSELSALVGFLADIKNTFLNAREEPPSTAKYALNVCHTRLETLEKELHRYEGYHSKTKMKYKWLLHPFKNTKIAYNSFRDSVLLLKDVCIFFMIQQNEVEHALFLLLSRQEVRQRLLETENILTGQFESGNRPHSRHDLQNSLVPQLHPHISGGNSDRAYQYQVDNESLLLLQRNLQRENPDSTVFTAVLCPEPLEGQLLQFAVARVLLDTGSDVNIISEKYLIEVGLSHLITQIPEGEQFEMSGIEEQGPAWKFERKFTSRFFLYSSRTTSEAEFFVTKSSDWDILISQKQYAKSAENSSTEKKLLWMPKKKRNQKDEASQREFEQRRIKELEGLRNTYAQRENQKRIHQHVIGSLPGASRAWTIDENRRVLMPDSMSSASRHEDSSSMHMTSMDEHRSRKQMEASIRSGTMQNGSDDESILREDEQRN